MGFNSYYMHGPFINEALIRGMADYLYTNNLVQLGCRFVVIDEGWTYPYGAPNGRDATGALVPDSSRFPDFPGLVQYVHSRGLLLGIYTEDTAKTAGGFIGSYGHFEQDAAAFAKWGVDFVKFDVYNTIDYLKPLAEFSALAWPTGYTGFMLESAMDLPGGDWVRVEAVPEVRQGTNLVGIEGTKTGQYFRLRNGE